MIYAITQPIFGKPLFYWWAGTALILSWMIILRLLANLFIGKPLTQITLKNKNPQFFFPYFPILDYPLIICFLYAWINVPLFCPAYFVFFSALTITIHTDLQHMLISRFVSLYLMPTGILLSFFGLTFISPLESIVSAIAGYGFLWVINKIFYHIKKHNGLGQGDLELLAFIASFIGLIGCWVTILVGSTLGTALGCLYMLITKKSVTVVPFGIFLAIGALIFVLFEPSIFAYLASTVDL